MKFESKKKISFIYTFVYMYMLALNLCIIYENNRIQSKILNEETNYNHKNKTNQSKR